MFGGKPFASGGFGCVFRPPLKCRDASTQSIIDKSPYITKLMMCEEGKSELRLINSIYDILKDVKNYKKHFLLHGTFLCDTLLPLTPDDLIGYDTICTSVNRKYNSRIINANLKYLCGLFSLYGGIDLDIEIQHLVGRFRTDPLNTIKSFNSINKGLINVLTEAIIPMNRLGVLHLDIKPGNLLIDTNYATTQLVPDIKIIDWGMSTTTRVMESIENSSFMFNQPLSIILFGDNLEIILDSYQEFYSHDIQANMGMFIKYVIKSLRLTHKGHYNTILSVLASINLPYESIEAYLSTVFKFILVLPDTYTKYRINMDAFLPIYRHNCDIFGLLSYYSLFISNFRHDAFISSRRLSMVHDQIKHIVRTYCYGVDYAVNYIPYAVILDEMKKISSICEDTQIDDTPLRRIIRAKINRQPKQSLYSRSPASPATMKSRKRHVPDVSKSSSIGSRDTSSRRVKTKLLTSK